MELERVTFFEFRDPPLAVILLLQLEEEIAGVAKLAENTLLVLADCHTIEPNLRPLALSPEDRNLEIRVNSGARNYHAIQS